MSFVQRPGFEYMDLDDFEEYLADKPEHEKWELIGGRVVKLMVGAQMQHHRIVRNLAFELEAKLRARGSDCDVFSETFWLKERFLSLAVFPDIMVQSGLPEDSDDTALNAPVVLVEVISPGSRNRDFGDKWDLYRRLPSLQHYLMIDRDRPVVDVFDRVDAASWTGPRRVAGMNGVIALPALAIDIPMSAIYRRTAAARRED